MSKTPVVGRPFRQAAVELAKINWPFLAGFGVTFAVVFKLSMSLSPEQAKESGFVKLHHSQKQHH